MSNGMNSVKSFAQDVQQLEKLCSTAGIAMWHWDATNDSLRWSTPPLFIERPDHGFADFLSPESLGALIAGMKRSVQDGSVLEMELEVSGNEGSRQWISVHGEPVRNSHNGFMGIRGILQDITERKQAEFANERATRALQAISECNRILVQSTSQKELVDGVCRVIVEQGGYRM